MLRKVTRKLPPGRHRRRPAAAARLLRCLAGSVLALPVAHLYLYWSRATPRASSTSSAASAQPLKSWKSHWLKLQSAPFLQQGRASTAPALVAARCAVLCCDADGAACRQPPKPNAGKPQRSRGAAAWQLHDVGHKAVVGCQLGLAKGALVEGGADGGGVGAGLSQHHPPELVRGQRGRLRAGAAGARGRHSGDCAGQQRRVCKSHCCLVSRPHSQLRKLTHTWYGGQCCLVPRQADSRHAERMAPTPMLAGCTAPSSPGIPHDVKAAHLE